MVRLVISLIIPIFFPFVLDYNFAGFLILFLAFLLWFAQNALLQVDYNRLKQIDSARPWYRSTSVALYSLAVIYFISELITNNIQLTLFFLIATVLILSKQVTLYRKELKAQTRAAQEVHIDLLQKSIFGIKKRLAKNFLSRMKLKISMTSFASNKTTKLRNL